MSSSALRATIDDRGLVDINWSNSFYIHTRNPGICNNILFQIKNNTTNSEWIVMSDVEEGVMTGQFFRTTQSKTLKVRLDERCEQVSVIAKGLLNVTTCHKCVGSVTSETSCDTNVQFDDLVPEFLNLKLVSSVKPPVLSRRAPVNKIRVSVERLSNKRIVVDLPMTYTGLWQVTVKRIGGIPPPTHSVFALLEPPDEQMIFHISESGRFHLSTIQRGCEYMITVEEIEPIATGSVSDCSKYFAITRRAEPIQIDTVLTKDEVSRIHTMAVLHATYNGILSGLVYPSRCIWLYRNKSPEYFSDINKSHGGVMEVYDKDNSGDPGCPINGRIKGLFFMASVEPGRNGEPAYRSQFGTTRLLIPVEVLLAKCDNFYFSDFYCMQGKYHYVTIVMTKRGSEADRFCQTHLPRIDLQENSDNPFFYRDSSSGEMRVSTRDHLHIELLYTENINMSDIIREGAIIKENVPTIGKGSSTKGGLPKNPSCMVCNLVQ